MTKNQKIKEAARYGSKIDFWKRILHIVIVIGDKANERIKQYTYKQNELMHSAMFGSEQYKPAKHEIKSQEAES